MGSEEEKEILEKVMNKLGNKESLSEEELNEYLYAQILLGD